MIHIFLSIISLIAIVLLVGNYRYCSRINSELNLPPNQKLLMNGWALLAATVGLVYLISLVISKLFM